MNLGLQRFRRWRGLLVVAGEEAETFALQPALFFWFGAETNDWFCRFRCAEQGWNGWADFLGHEGRQVEEALPFKEARACASIAFRMIAWIALAMSWVNMIIIVTFSLSARVRVRVRERVRVCVRVCVRVRVRARVQPHPPRQPPPPSPPPPRKLAKAAAPRGALPSGKLDRPRRKLGLPSPGSDTRKRRKSPG